MNEEVKKLIDQLKASDPVRGELFAALADKIDGVPGADEHFRTAAAAFDERAASNLSNLMTSIDSFRPKF